MFKCQSHYSLVCPGEQSWHRFPFILSMHNLLDTSFASGRALGLADTVHSQDVVTVLMNFTAWWWRCGGGI